MDAGAVAALRAARWSYREVGATKGAPPAGYRTLRRVVRLPGTRDLESAARLLFTWQVHSRAGLRVVASDRWAAPGSVVVLGWGLGPLRVRAPCRVVYVIDEARLRGFAYGTLPGHPESGEEAFILEELDDGAVTFTITAFSRPATMLAKVGGPLSRAAQDAVTGRYLAALT